MEKFKQPYQMLPSDPMYPNGRSMLNSSMPKRVVLPQINNSNYKKVLTNTNKRSRIKSVIKIRKRKDENMKTPEKSKTSKRFDYRGAVKSVAWLIEASFRGFVGWTLLQNFDDKITTAAAIYSIGTALMIIALHFVRAHRK